MNGPIAQIACIGFGGALGAVLRYAVTGPIMGAFVGPEGTRFPWGVLGVNLVGCFFIGIVAAALIERPADDRLRLLLAAGFLGSFTTFSAFGLDTLELLRAKAIGLAALNVGLSVVLGVIAAAGGWALAQRMVHA